MKQTNSNINVDANIQKAQDAVEVNLARFESALAHLADRVEQTSHRVEHVGELARRSRDELMHLKDTAQVAIEPLLPFIRSGKEVSVRAISGVKQNPKSFLWAFAGIVGAFLAYRSFQGRQIGAGTSASSYVPSQNNLNDNFSASASPNLAY